MTLCLFRLTQYYVSEVRRGHHGVGEYVLRQGVFNINTAYLTVLCMLICYPCLAYLTYLLQLLCLLPYIRSLMCVNFGLVSPEFKKMKGVHSCRPSALWLSSGNAFSGAITTLFCLTYFQGGVTAVSHGLHAELSSFSDCSCIYCVMALFRYPAYFRRY